MRREDTTVAALVQRHARGEVDDALDDSRVVVLSGARQVGKTTLVRQLVARRGGSYLTLDDPLLAEIAREDPMDLLAGRAEPVVVDEVQRGGDALVRAVKRAVDEDPRPGRFLLTGSARFTTVPGLSESLVGRAAVVDLWPLSQGEVEGREERFADLVFDDPARLLSSSSAASQEELLDRVVRGGYPEGRVRAVGRSRSRWFESYVRTLVQRDIRELADLRRIDDVPRLLRLAAARTAQEVDASDLAAEAGLPRSTVQDYLPLLETVFLLTRSPAWATNATSKVVRRPKGFVTDSGLASHLVGVDERALADPTSRLRDPLVETFVVGELRKQRTWAATRFSLHHFRDRGGLEVDVVMEAADGRVAGIEVKSGRSVRTSDTRALRLLRDRLGDRFTAGIVLYAGEDAQPLSERLWALPIPTLWRA